MLNYNLRKLLSVAICTAIGASTFAQSWKHKAICNLQNGEFNKVENTIQEML